MNAVSFLLLYVAATGQKCFIQGFLAQMWMLLQCASLLLLQCRGVFAAAPTRIGDGGGVRGGGGYKRVKGVVPDDLQARPVLAAQD